MIRHIDVHAVLQQSSSGFYADLVTRSTGRVVRERIEQVLARPDGGGTAALVTRMDFSGVGCVDHSCADEIVAKLLRAAATLIILGGLRDGHREAIEPVLAHYGLAVVLEGPDGALDALGDPRAGSELLEALVAQRLAARRPEGGLALTGP